MAIAAQALPRPADPSAAIPCANCRWTRGNHEPTALPARLGMTCGDYAAPAPALSASVGRPLPWWEREDEPKSHYHTPRRAFEGKELVSYDDDPETGCMIWTGPFKPDKHGTLYPHLGRPHKLCGRDHYTVARALKEEALGRRLDEYDEVVFGTCRTNLGQGSRPCINPAHHELRSRA